VNLFVVLELLSIQRVVGQELFSEVAYFDVIIDSLLQVELVGVQIHGLIFWVFGAWYEGFGDSYDRVVCNKRCQKNHNGKFDHSDYASNSTKHNFKIENASLDFVRHGIYLIIKSQNSIRVGTDYLGVPLS